MGEDKEKAVGLEQQELINNIPGAVVKMRYENGLIVEYANDMLFEMMKVSRENFCEIYDNHYEKIMYHMDFLRLQESIEKALKGDKKLSMEYRIVTGNNLNQWRMIRASILGERDNAPILQCVITDITQQKNMQMQLDSLINHSIAGIIRICYDAAHTNVEYISDKVASIVGYPKSSIQKALLHDEFPSGILLDERKDRIPYSLNELLNGKNQMTQEFQILRGDRQKIWLEVKGAVVSRTEKNIVAQYIVTDITQSKEAYLELEKEKKKLSAIVEMSGDMIFEYDIEQDKMSYTSPGQGILGAEQITDHYTERIAHNERFQEKEYASRLAALLRSGQKSFAVELHRADEGKESGWVLVTGKTIFDKNDKPEKVLGKIHNIDEQKKKEEELREKSQKDSLTGLLNHMAVKKEISERINKLTPDMTAYLIVCDVDNFKQINDTNGHLFGDAVICSFADEMSNLLPDAIKGRIGGDEFIFYIEGYSRERVQELLVALNKSMADRYNDDKMGLHISSSLGCAVIKETGLSYDSVFQWADSALYKVKSSGKSSYLLVDVVKNMDLPSNTYLTSSRNAETYSRRETLIRNEDELALFCVELLENVPNVNNALRMISERICSFFSLDDMVCVEHVGGKNRIIYQWSRKSRHNYTQRMLEENVYVWEHLLEKQNEKGIIIYHEEMLPGLEMEEAKTAMVVLSGEIKDYCGSIVFCDRKKDKTWEAEQDILVRIANAIFNRLRNLRKEEEERQKIDLQVNYDGLTGFPVYNKFIPMAEEYLQKYGRRKNFCIYSDFSNFQYVNEVYGYETGDLILKEFAQRLQTEYGDSAVFCRITSDYFVGILRGEDIQEAFQRYHEFTYGFGEEYNLKYDQCNIAIASGIYDIQESDKSIASMIDNANEARKACKQQKVVSAVKIYNDEIKQQAESAKEIVSNMVGAYNNKEFHAYLQPKVSLKTGKIVGAEALVRWIRPDGSEIMPADFIDICERNGFITRIDFIMLEQVMEYLQDALAKGEEVVPVSVNFSRRHNEFEDFIPSVLKRFDKYNVPTNLIEAEVTESVFLYDLDQLNQSIRKLRERGVEISVDDFGSGYSSLNILTKLEVDTIKLDKLFLSNAQNDPGAFTVVKYLIKMLKHLGFKVLAEGAETAEQVEMLKKADCDLVQGFFYAKAMPIEKFRVFLREFNEENELRRNV